MLFAGTSGFSYSTWKGKFYPSSLAGANIIYTFHADGMTDSAGQEATADFSLAPRAVELQGVVAVGYGTQRRETITSAISSASSDQFNQTPARDAGSLIAGKIPGLAISTPSGDPTSGTQINHISRSARCSGTTPASRWVLRRMRTIMNTTQSQ